MPKRSIRGTDATYYLLSLDEGGAERREGDGSRLSESLIALMGERTQPFTDVFFASHGWKGDVPAAIEQYDNWVGEMARSPHRHCAPRRRDGFKSLVIGLHWPSLPFGDESLPPESGLLSDGGTLPLENAAELYASSISGTDRAKEAIRTILDADQRDSGEEEHLPPEVAEAYDVLFRESSLPPVGGTPAAPPGEDFEAWDPDAIYRQTRERAGIESGGAGTLGFWDKVKGALVSPLQQLSFWKMKDRARVVGERGAHALLVQLQQAAPVGTRFHLMGHSFGCIVVSAAIAGTPPLGPALVRPVDSLFLVQGALSLWSYCPNIPFARGTAGYFNTILKGSLVGGPIVTTRSRHDRAVGTLYPAGAAVPGDVVLDDDLPKYGGLGTFGAMGLGPQAEDLSLTRDQKPYAFVKGRVYNLEASEVIKSGGGFSGAHSDIAHPELAHAHWEAVLPP